MKSFPLFRYFWLLALVVNVINALIFRSRIQSVVRQRPELAAGYRSLLRGNLFWGSLPWIVMGIGIEFGGVHNVFSYFNPRRGNPFVLTWFGVIVAMWIVGFYWLFFRRGAEFLAEHPGMVHGIPNNPAAIRRFYCLALTGGIAGVVFMYFANFPEILP